mmetsp:Transcript_17868/g.36602  ORF Transcript_17868/g.36602 Transcript_17868/m.36602 type:complete len:153 (-) Transcript_17868:18-476(-)
MSKWFVGSSKSSNAGWMNRALASATRMRQPPLNSLVIIPCRARLNPSPLRIRVALVSAVSASSSSSRSYRSLSRSKHSSCAASLSASSIGSSAAAAAVPLPLALSPSIPGTSPAMKLFNSSISSSTACLSASTLITASKAVSSVGGYSVVRW